MRISDWSSDVCSSDLAEDAAGRATATLGDPLRLVKYDYDGQGRLISVTRHLAPNGGGIGGSFVTTYVYGGLDSRIEIGRASCRASVCQDVVILVVAVV